MKWNAVLPRLIWNVFGAAALFGNAHGSDDVVARAAIEAAAPAHSQRSQNSQHSPHWPTVPTASISG